MTLATRKWTRAEYQKMGETGLIGPEERVELIQGEIVRMTPIDPLHANAVDLATEIMVKNFSETHQVRVQGPVGIGDHSEPQPDLCLIPKALFRALMMQGVHPEQVDLLIEIANTSLSYDRGRKLRLYASGGYPLYWIVNLKQGQLEVYSQPQGTRYACSTCLSLSDHVELLGRSLPVKDFFPPQVIRNS